MPVLLIIKYSQTVALYFRRCYCSNSISILKILCYKNERGERKEPNSPVQTLELSFSSHYTIIHMPERKLDRRKAPCGSLAPEMLASHFIFTQREQQQHCRTTSALTNESNLARLEKTQFHDCSFLRAVFTGQSTAHRINF